MWSEGQPGALSLPKHGERSGSTQLKTKKSFFFLLFFFLWGVLSVCLSPSPTNLISLSIHTSATLRCLYVLFSVTVSSPQTLPTPLLFSLPSCLPLHAKETLRIRAPSSLSKHPRVISISLRSANWYSRHALAAKFFFLLLLLCSPETQFFRMHPSCVIISLCTQATSRSFGEIALKRCLLNCARGKSKKCGKLQNCKICYRGDNPFVQGEDFIAVIWQLVQANHFLGGGEGDGERKRIST